MAFGKPTESKRLRNAVLEDKLWRNYVISEEKTLNNWKNKWSWILKEYDVLHEKLAELSKDKEKGSQGSKDQRCIYPVPESTNHEYGWIANKPGFNNNEYGPDVDKGAPLPDMYRIIKH